MVHEMTLKQDHRRTHDFATVRTAIKAIEEVRIDLVVSLTNFKPKLYQCHMEMNGEITAFPVPTFSASLCKYTKSLSLVDP